MAVNITNADGSLYFAAGIDLSDFDKDRNKMLAAFEELRKKVADLSKMSIKTHIDSATALKQIGQIEIALGKATAKGFDTGRLYQQLDEVRRKASQPLAIPVTADTKSAVASIETLRAKMLLKQQAIIETTDIKKIAQYNKEIEGLQTQITTMSNAGKKGFDDMGNAVEKTAKKGNILQRSFNFLKQAALFLPGIGIVGLMGLLSDSVIELVTNLLKGEKAFDGFTKRIKAVGDAFESNVYQSAVKNVNELRINIDLAKKGLIDKEAVLRQYNQSIGQTTGEVKSLDAAEQALTANADAYIKMTLNKAAAQSLLDEAAKKAVEIAKKRNLADAKTVQNITSISEAEAKRAEFLKTDPTYKALAKDLQLAVLSSDAEWQKTMETRVEEYKEAVLERFRFGKELKEQSGLEDLAKEFQTKAAQIAAEFNFNFAGTEKWGKEKEHHEKVNALIGKRLTLMEQIEGLRRDGIQAGLIKEESALDKISEKYDRIIADAKAFNKEVDKAKQKDKVAKIDVSEIEALRKVEYQNTVYKQDAEAYQKGLEEKRALFNQFQETQKQVGIDKAREMYAEQTKGFKSYLDYLRSQLTDKGLVLKIQTGTANIGEILKFRAIAKEINDEEKRLGEQKIKDAIEVFQVTSNYAQKRAAIETHYNRLFEALKNERVRMTEEEYEERLKALQNAQGDELTALQNQVLRTSHIYRKMSTDIISFNRAQIKEHIKGLRKDLADGFTFDAKGNQVFLTPQMKKDLEDYINQLEEFYATTSETFGLSIKQLGALQNKAAAVAAVFGQMADAVTPLNARLGETLREISGIGTAMGSAFSAMSDISKGKAFADAGDLTKAAESYAAAAQSIGALVSQVINVFVEAKRTAQEAKEQIAQFNQDAFLGEFEINELYRERLRTQQDINDLTIKGLEEQRKMLQAQTKSVRDDYKRLFDELQKEQYIAGEKEKKGKGSLFFGLVGYLTGIGAKTSVEKEMQSLLGKSYEQIEKLFLSNQLTEHAAALFQQLQQLKKEGADVDRALQDLQEQANQIFTGTTADSLTNSIAEMFRQGKTSVTDFATFFKESMGDAALSIFKNQQIQERMQAFYKDFAEAAQSDQQLTETEIDTLRRSFSGSMEELSKLFEDMQKVTGLNFKQQSQSVNSVQSAIRAQLTEETGTILAGHSNAMRISLMDLVRLANLKVAHLNEISNNTANTVNRMDRLLAKVERIESGQTKIKVVLQ